MNTTAHLQQLGRGFGFTLEELLANQRGELHPAQRARLLRRGRVALLACVLLGVLALVGAFVGADAMLGLQPSAVDLQAARAVQGLGTMAGLGFFAGAAASYRRRRVRRAAVAAGRIERLEGPMNKIHVSGRGMPNRNIIQVGRFSLDVKPAPWALLTQGAAYRLFFLDGQLLSLTPVLDDPAERAGYDEELAAFERSRHVRASARVR